MLLDREGVVLLEEGGVDEGVDEGLDEVEDVVVPGDLEVEVDPAEDVEE